MKKFVEKDLNLFEAINKGVETHLKGSESLPNINPISKASDVAYVRFSVPDLKMYKRWLIDFGFKIIFESKDSIYSRGLSGDGFCHVVHKGPAKFLGFAMQMGQESDLSALHKKIDGCTKPHEIPGIEGEISGGKRVSFIDPVCGFLVEAVYGRKIDKIQPQRERVEYNYGDKKKYRRPSNKLQDISGNREADGSNTIYPGPPEILKIGHVVIAAPVGLHHKMMEFMMKTFALSPQTDLI